MTESITIRLATPDDAEIIYQQRLAMFEDIWGPLDPDGVATMESTFIPWVCRGLADGSYRGWLACDDDGRVVAGDGMIIHEWMTHPTTPIRAVPISRTFTQNPTIGAMESRGVSCRPSSTGAAPRGSR